MWCPFATTLLCELVWELAGNGVYVFWVPEFILPCAHRLTPCREIPQWGGAGRPARLDHPWLTNRW